MTVGIPTEPAVWLSIAPVVLEVRRPVLRLAAVTAMFIR